MSKTVTEQYSNVVFLKDDTVQKEAYTLVNMKPDYSKMYFEFQFKDGEKARYRMDKDCHDLQQFLDRMNHFHDLEKENKRLQKRNEKLEKMAFHYTPEEWNTMLRTIERLQEQLNEANKTIKKAQELCPDKNAMLMCNPARPSFGMMTNDVLTKYLEKWGVK